MMMAGLGNQKQEFHPVTAMAKYLYLTNQEEEPAIQSKVHCN